MREEKLNSGPSVMKRKENGGMKKGEKSRKGERRRSFTGANRYYSHALKLYKL